MKSMRTLLALVALVSLAPSLALAQNIRRECVQDLCVSAALKNAKGVDALKNRWVIARS